MYFTSRTFSLIIFICQANLRSSSGMRYLSKTNEYITASAKLLTEYSVIECCAKCNEDTSCLAINFGHLTNTCGLLSVHPSILGISTVSASNWMVYYKDLCGINWFLYNGRCYLVVTNVLTWHDALINCRTALADLVDIGDDAENSFTHDVVRHFGIEKFWIGLNELDADGNWTWSSGNPFVFDDFGPGEPNSKLERCVEAHTTEGWNNILCGYQQSSICEKSVETMEKIKT